VLIVTTSRLTNTSADILPLLELQWHLVNRVIKCDAITCKFLIKLHLFISLAFTYLLCTILSPTVDQTSLIR
jgi:hypothetical protein